MEQGAAQYLFAGIPVANHDRSLLWYEKIFARSPDVIVTDGVESMWEIVRNGWIYIVRDPERAGQALVTITVADLDLHTAEIVNRGIPDYKTEILPGIYRKAIFTDDDGNTVTFAQLHGVPAHEN